MSRLLTPKLALVLFLGVPLAAAFAGCARPCVAPTDVPCLHGPDARTVGIGAQPPEGHGQVLCNTVYVPGPFHERDAQGRVINPCMHQNFP